MPAYLLLVAAVLSRLIPHAPWFNFTAVGGSLLFFGARRSWKEMLVPMVALMATDYALTVLVYHYSFVWQSYLVTWLWYAAAMVLGRILLGDKTSFARVASAVILGPTSFFLVSNFAFWVTESAYPQTPMLYPQTPRRSGSLLHRGAAFLWQRPRLDSDCRRAGLWAACAATAHDLGAACGGARQQFEVTCQPCRIWR